MRDPQRREFTASGDLRATSDDWLVPKSEADHEMWNRLRGKEVPT